MEKRTLKNINIFVLINEEANLVNNSEKVAYMKQFKNLDKKVNNQLNLVNKNFYSSIRKNWNYNLKLFSMHQLTMLFGSFLGSPLGDKIGR